MKKENDIPMDHPRSVMLVVCDKAYRDSVSGNMVLAGTFNAIRSKTYPVRFTSMDVVFTLTDGRGQFEAGLRIEHAATGEAIFEIKGPMVLDDPLVIHDYNVRLHQVIFPEPGKYVVELLIDGLPINSRPLMLLQNTQDEGQENAG